MSDMKFIIFNDTLDGHIELEPLFHVAFGSSKKLHSLVDLFSGRGLRLSMNYGCEVVLFYAL